MSERLGTPGAADEGHPQQTPAAAVRRGRGPTTLEPLSPELAAASIRLRIAAPHAAYLRQKARVAALEPVLDIEKKRQGISSMTEAERAELGAAIEQLAKDRVAADSALQKAYEAHYEPPYERAFDRDLDLLHARILNDTKSGLQTLWDFRQDELGRMLLRYADPENLRDLGIAAAMALSCRAPIPFAYVTEESTVVPGYTPKLFPRPVPSNPARYHSLRWQAWMDDLWELPDVVAIIGHADGGALREDILKTHPILALTDKVWPAPEHMRRVISGESLDGDPEAVGKRVFDALFDELRSGLEALSVDPTLLGSSGRAYRFARPMYFQVGASLFCKSAGHHKLTEDPMFQIVELAHQRHAPRDKYAALQHVLLAAGLALIIAGFVVGPAFFVASIVLEVSLGAIATGLQAREYMEAARLAEASEAEQAFQALDPTIRAYETGQSASFEAVLLGIEILFFALPAITPLFPRAQKTLTKAEMENPNRGGLSLSDLSKQEGGLMIVPDTLPGASAGQDAGAGGLSLPRRPPPATPGAGAELVPPTARVDDRVPGAADLEELLFRDIDFEPVEIDAGVTRVSLPDTARKTSGDLPQPQAGGELIGAADNVADARGKNAPGTSVTGTAERDIFAPARERLTRGKPVVLDTTLSRLKAAPRAKTVWDFFQRNRVGFVRLTSSDAGALYRELLDAWGIPKTRRALRELRGYTNDRRKDDLLQAFWARQDPPLAVDLNAGPGQKPDWWYRVDDSGKLHPRGEVDFGHIVDVVVFDKLVFVLESDIALMLYRKTIDLARADQVWETLRDVFMNFQRNYVPELKGPNRRNGATLPINYADDMTAKAAVEIMLSAKATEHLPSSAEHPLDVLQAILEDLHRQVPELERLGKWVDALQNRPVAERPVPTTQLEPAFDAIAAERGLDPPAPSRATVPASARRGVVTEGR